MKIAILVAVLLIAVANIGAYYFYQHSSYLGAFFAVTIYAVIGVMTAFFLNALIDARRHINKKRREFMESEFVAYWAKVQREGNKQKKDE